MGEPLSLSEFPKDKELEEYLNAYFQAVGYYTERNIIERETTEVLELDSILYDYSQDIPKTLLVEIKSGQWGFPEIFKVLGWKHYLNIDSPVFVTSTSKGSDSIDDYYIKKSNEIGVNLCIVKDLETTGLCLIDLLKGKSVETLDINSWRYSYWIEREILQKLQKQKKSETDTIRYKTMLDYYHNINNVSFFTDNILDKIKDIYAQFQSNSNLVARVANEVNKNGFVPEVIPKALYTSTFYDSEVTDLTTATYLEYRSRLAILKNVVDFILYKRIDPSSPKACETYKFFGFTSTKFSLLPSELRERIEILKDHKYIHLYPVFWQWFQWLFGGFILLDYKDKEYKLFSDKTGIPVEYIDQAFDAYKILFPTTNWFVENRNSNIKHLKMFPSVFMGVGTNYRKDIYTEDEKYRSLNLTLPHTLDDIIKWNNSAYFFLKKEKS
jgi:hypothetical protein